MLYEDFHSEFTGSVDKGDLKGANNALMKELGNILVRKREDFVHLLNEAEIPATVDMSDVRLVDLFVSNIPHNKNLALGASLLVNVHNKQMGFDGETEMSDEGVKTGYSVMRSYFCGRESHSNAGGGILGAIGNIVQGGSSVATKAMEGNQKKKYGALDMANKQAEAKAAMTQQILAQRQAEIAAKQAAKEHKAKTTRTILIVGGAVLGLAIIGVVIYAIKKHKK